MRRSKNSTLDLVTVIWEEGMEETSMNPGVHLGMTGR